MTIAQSLQLAVKSLNESRIDSPHLEAELLLSHVLKKPREFLLAHGEKKLTSRQLAGYNSLIKRRLKGEPIAYLTGHKEFYGLDFMVNKNALIPRPETELMIDEALKLAARNAKRVTLIDIGTGSGCIIITLTRILKHHEFFAIDLSAKALAVARQNAKAHQVNKNIKFLKGDLLKPLIKSKIKNQKSKILLANLPYGWKAWKNNSSAQTIGLKFEPEIALYTSKNGLALYEKLFKQIKELRVRRYAPRDMYVLCEIDPRQTAKMKQLIKQLLPRAKFQIKKDLRGLNRLIIITLK